MFKIGDRVKIIGKNVYCDEVRYYTNNEFLYIERFRHTTISLVVCYHTNNRYNFYIQELVLYKKILEDV